MIFSTGLGHSLGLWGPQTSMAGRQAEGEEKLEPRRGKQRNTGLAPVLGAEQHGGWVGGLLQVSNEVAVT